MNDEVRALCETLRRSLLENKWWLLTTTGQVFKVYEIQNGKARVLDGRTTRHIPEALLLDAKAAGLLVETTV